MDSAIVFGAGVSGKSAARLLLRHGVRVSVSCPGDVSAAEGLRTAGAEIFEGDAVSAARVFAARGNSGAVAYLSPGIPTSAPEAELCRRAGIPITGELETGSAFLTGRIFAVTGSKGKSSVVKFIADALSMNGTKALPCGNYGIALNEIAGMEYQPDVAVVECSSFQLETLGGGFKPEIALVLNLSDDHLDRHGDVVKYRDIKLDIFRNMGAGGLELLPAPSGDPHGLFARHRELHGRDAVSFGRGADAQWRWCAGAVVNEKRGFRANVPAGYFSNEILGPAAAAACAVLDAAGLSAAAIEQAFQSFEPLPHRMQFVDIVDGVKCVDDSKATSIAALLAGVRMASPPVYLIAGGRLKEKITLDGKELVTSGVEKVYLIGECMDAMEAAWVPALPMKRCVTLAEAVSSAFRDARGGGTILLSPGTASFDQYNDYKQRGEEFSRLVGMQKKTRVTPRQTRLKRSTEMNKSLLRGTILAGELAVAAILIQGCRTYDPYTGTERTAFGRGRTATEGAAPEVVVEVGGAKTQQVGVTGVTTADKVGMPGTYPEKIIPEGTEIRDPYEGLTRTNVRHVPTAPVAQTSANSGTTVTASDGKYVIYTVKSGDTAGQIANSHGMTKAEFVRVNNIANPDHIRVGQKFKVVSGGKPLAGGRVLALPGKGQYVVVSGDTLGGIAIKHKVKVADLMAANGITNPNHIRAGQKLVIPGAKGAVMPSGASSAGAASTPDKTPPAPSGDSGSEPLVQPIVDPPADPTLDSLIDQAMSGDSLFDVKGGSAAPAVGTGAVTPDNTGAGFVEYTVKEGEDIYSVSSKFKASPMDIRRLNNITGSSIPAGTTVKVPASGK